MQSKICRYIDLMAGSNQELQDLTDRLQRSAAAYGMEISAEKSKVMVNSREDRTASITMDGKPLEAVDRFKYLGATLSSDGTSTAEIKTRIATATAAMTKLNKIWKSNILLRTKYRLYKSLVLSVLLYGCEAWTLLAETERKIEAFEFKCMRKILQISYREHKTNAYVLDRITSVLGPQESLLSIVKKRKLGWFGHVTRHSGLTKTILQGTVEGGRSRGRPRKSWSDNVKEWTRLSIPELVSKAADRPEWRNVTSAAVLHIPPTANQAKG